MQQSRVPQQPTDIRILPARSDSEIAAFRTLCEEYAASLPFIAVSLAHQGFSNEMTALPGKYAPPRGEMLLAVQTGAYDNAGVLSSGLAVGVVGVVAMRPLDDEDEVEMKRMYVSPSARGLGVGRALGAAIVAAARQAGYRRMKLDTDKSMDAAMAVYRGLGFRECPPYNTDPCPNTLWFEMDLENTRA